MGNTKRVLITYAVITGEWEAYIVAYLSAGDVKEIFRKQFLQKEYYKVAIDVAYMRGKSQISAETFLRTIAYNMKIMIM